MARVYNFSAGPAMLPEAVIAQAQAEMLDWHGTGMSVMEMSHRGSDYAGIIAQAEADLRYLLSVPDNYKVLFLQGGASLQFAMIPMNLAQAGDQVDYVNTGVWSEKAIKEAQRFCQVNQIAHGTTSVPETHTWQFTDQARYVHYTPNETIAGLEFHQIPNVGDRVLVADMSSTILSRPVDVSKFGLIYAGAQKNIGPAGLCIVIVREDLIGHARPGTPTMLDYKVAADHGSMYNTPATYAWYISGLVFAWLRQQGGLSVMAEINQRKAHKLYHAIDHSQGFYHNPVNPADRSWMNVPFTLKNPQLDTVFLSEAKTHGLVNLKGHKLVGGMRASIYNAMPEAGVDALVTFMHDFAQRHG